MLGDIIYALRDRAKHSHTSEFDVPVDYSLHHRNLALNGSGGGKASLVYKGVVIGHSGKQITAETTGASILPGGSRVSHEIIDLAQQLAGHGNYRLDPSIFWDEIIITATGPLEQMTREFEYANEALTR